MYALSPFVNQIWIPGDSQRSFLLAVRYGAFVFFSFLSLLKVVVPAENYCRAWAEEFGLGEAPLSELCKVESLVMIRKDLFFSFCK